MDNLQPVSNIDPSELPKGFTTSDPTGRNTSNGGDASSSAAAEKQQREEQKQNILEQVLEPEALARLRRIKLVKPEKAAKLENAIASMAMSGRLPGRINEGKLIEMLERGASAENATEKPIRIQRKKYAIDSDDENDNDDDL